MFEHRHTHDQAFLRSFYWHSLTLSPSYMLLWAGLFAVGMVLAVQSIREGAKGTAAEFCAWLAQEHPEITQSGKR